MKSWESNLWAIQELVDELNYKAMKVNTPICHRCMYNDIEFDGHFCVNCALYGETEIQFRRESR